MKRSSLVTLSLCMVIAILGVALVSSYSNIQTNHLNDSARLTGTVLVQVKDQNGTVVSQTKNDTIWSGSYDYIYCQLFDYTQGCSVANNQLDPITVTITTTATLTLPYTLYTMTGLALATSSQTNNACAGQQSTNGLAPLVASTNHVIGQNSPLTSLTGSWTYTGTGVTIQSVCLLPTETLIGSSQTVVSSSYAFASENFAGQTLSNGQSITITWTFNM